MEEAPIILTVAVGEPPIGVVAELESKGFRVAVRTLAEAEEVIAEDSPLLVVLSGAKGATELSTLLEDQPEQDRVQVVIIAPRRELARLMGLNRDIVVALLATEMGEKTLASRVDALCRQAARRRGIMLRNTAAVRASAFARPEHGFSLSPEHPSIPSAGLPHGTALGMPEPPRRRPDAALPVAPPPAPESLAPEEFLSVPAAPEQMDLRRVPSKFDPSALLDETGLTDESSGALEDKLTHSPVLGQEAPSPLGAVASEPPEAIDESDLEPSSLPPPAGVPSLEPATDAGSASLSAPTPPGLPVLESSLLEISALDDDVQIAHSAAPDRDRAPREPASEPEHELPLIRPRSTPPPAVETEYAPEMLAPTGAGAAFVQPHVAKAAPPPPGDDARELHLPGIDPLPARLGVPSRSDARGDAGSGKVLAGFAVVGLISAGVYFALPDPPSGENASTKVPASASAPVAESQPAPPGPSTPPSPPSAAAPADAAPSDAAAAVPPPSTPAAPIDAPPGDAAAAAAAPPPPSAPVPSPSDADKVSAPAAAISPGELLDNPFRIPDKNLPGCGELAAGVTAQTRDPIAEASVHWATARKFIVKGDVAEASRAMCLAVAINPASPALEGLTSLYVMSDSPARAIEFANKALAVRPNERETLNLRGDAYSQLGQTEKAIEDWLAALGLRPDETSRRAVESKNHAVEARRAEKRGDLVKASQFYRRSLGLDPANVIALSGLGGVMLATGHLDQAATLSVWALRILEAIPEAHVVLGDVALAKGNRAGAKAAYERALAIRPDFWPAETKLRALP